MMAAASVSLLQALQLVALVPSLFVVAMMLYLTRNYSRIVVPIAFFLALACSFAHPLLLILGIESAAVGKVLAFAQMLQPALSFLLMIQFIGGNSPHWRYWLVMALPVVGSLIFWMGDVRADEWCPLMSACMPKASAQLLYNVFTSSFIFLLLMVILLSNREQQTEQNQQLKQHKYWLVIALISLNLIQLADDLMLLAEKISDYQHETIATVLRITFIYLVQASIFRVFDQSMSFGVAPLPQRRDFTVSMDLVHRLELAMTKEQLYREPNVNRDGLAEHLAVGEQALSRTINQHFGCNFSEFINRYRVEEAKQRLITETTPVTAIAFEVGFNSIASFNRVFRQSAGCSPTEYRAKNTPAGANG